MIRFNWFHIARHRVIVASQSVDANPPVAANQTHAVIQTAVIAAATAWDVALAIALVATAAWAIHGHFLVI